MSSSMVLCLTYKLKKSVFNDSKNKEKKWKTKSLSSIKILLQKKC